MQSFYPIVEMGMYYVLFPVQVLALILYTTLEGFPGLVKRFNMHLLIAGLAICGLSVWMYSTIASSADSDTYPFHILLGLAGSFLTMLSKRNTPEPPAE